MTLYKHGENKWIRHENQDSKWDQSYKQQSTKKNGRFFEMSKKRRFFTYNFVLEVTT